MTKEVTNKLSIYLIKTEYSNTEDIFKNFDKLQTETITDIGIFYHGESYVSAPSWVKKFFGESFKNSFQDEENKDRLKIFTASSKAAFVASSENRIFVITFGYGHTMLNPGTWEERFGLKVALNVIDSENLRSIDKKNMSVTPKLSKEQITKDGTFADFGIDIEQDLIQGITGKSKDITFGQTVTGKDALSVSVKINISNIKPFLKTCYEKYQSDDYKKDFGWIDQVSEIKTPKLIQELDDKLIKKIKNNDFDKTWMAIPEIVAWEDVSEFKNKDNSFGDDIDLESFLSFLSEEDKNNLSLKILNNCTINCISASRDDVMKSWKAYNCLYCEISNSNETFILSNGKWYQVEKSFAEQIFKDFDNLKKQSSGISLPKCKQGEHENIYNERIAKELSICNMDRKTINHGGANQKIEFCDLLTTNKKLVHVKHYGASSVLSHLFSQGLVSGELFLSDIEFRKKLNDELPMDYKISDATVKPKSSDYEIVFAIISKSKSELDIPFFSKVNIRNAKRKLETFGYNVSILKIETEDKEE